MSRTDVTVVSCPLERDTKIVTYQGDGMTLRIEFTADTVGLFYADSPADVAQKGDFTRLSLNLLETATAEMRDVRSVAEAFNTLLAKGGFYAELYNSR